MKISISGGSKHSQDITKAVIEWCSKFFNLKDDLHYVVEINPKKDCWGYCEKREEERVYAIYIADNQTIRDFTATLTHEMVHVKQWETGCWVGVGEREAEKLQYLLADEIWKKGLI